MRLICTNDADCSYTCADFEAAGPYAAPECPRCWSSMEPLGDRLDPRFAELAAAEERRLADDDAWYLERKGVIELPEYQDGWLRRRQAGG